MCSLSLSTVHLRIPRCHSLVLVMCNNVWYSLWHCLHWWADLRFLAWCPGCNQFKHTLLDLMIVNPFFMGQSFEFWAGIEWVSFPLHVTQFIEETTVAGNEGTCLPGWYLETWEWLNSAPVDFSLGLMRTRRLVLVDPIDCHSVEYLRTLGCVVAILLMELEL